MRWILVFKSVLLLILLLQAENIQAQTSVKATRRQLVMVTITTYGITIYPEKIAAGPIFLFINNQTMIPTPQIIVKREPEKGVVVESPAEKFDELRPGEAQEARKLILTSGRYVVSIPSAKNRSIALTVTPQQ